MIEHLQGSSGSLLSFQLQQTVSCAPSHRQVQLGSSLCLSFSGSLEKEEDIIIMEEIWFDDHTFSEKFKGHQTKVRSIIIATFL